MNLQRIRHIRSRKLGIAALAIASLGLLNACSSQESSVNEAQPSSSASASRQAGNLGTRVCFNNLAERAVVIYIAKADTGKGTNTVDNKTRFCTEGTSTFGNDISGEVDKGNTYSLPFSANNPTFSPPEFTVTGDFCSDPGRASMSVNDTQSTRSPILKMQITRLPDGKWKNFEVDLTPGDHKIPFHDYCQDHPLG